MVKTIDTKLFAAIISCLFANFKFFGPCMNWVLFNDKVTCYIVRNYTLYLEVREYFPYFYNGPYIGCCM